MPPAAADRVPVPKSSRSRPPASAKWTCGSIAPGTTRYPVRSVNSSASARPRRPGASSLILPSLIQMSRRAAVFSSATVAPYRTVDVTVSAGGRCVRLGELRLVGEGNCDHAGPRLRAEQVENHANEHDDAERDELRQLELRPVESAGKGCVRVAILPEPIRAEPGPEDHNGGEHGPDRGQAADDPHATAPAWNPERPVHMRVRVTQLDQGREDQDVGNHGERDHQAKHNAEVFGGVAVRDRQDHYEEH